MLSATTDRQCRITLPPVPESARAAREFTVAALRKWHLGPLVSDAVLIASELVTNAISHGTAGACDEPAAPVELTWSYQVSRLICVVTDHAAEPPVVAPADTEDESGHGLQIVAALSAAWGWTMLGTGEKAVWAALHLPPGTSGAAAPADGGQQANAAIPAAVPGRPAAGLAADLGRRGPFPAAR